jgi:glycosyltransferase involved in cell wall biosynthesis
MKILMVSSYLPYPLLDGGRIRLYNLIKLLGEKHEITLICEKWPPQTEKDVEQVRKICKKVVVFDRPKAMSIGNISKSLLSADSMLKTVHSHKEFKKIIDEELEKNQFDLIHAETYYIMQNIPKTKVPIVLVEHNLEYEVYKKNAKKANIILKPLLLFDAVKLRREERHIWRNATKLVVVSAYEQKIMGTHAELVPNGVDLNKFKFVKKEFKKTKKKILFIGNFKWMQNRDSAAFIIKNVWPIIRNKNKNLYLWVVGKNIPESIKKLENDSIKIDENAPNETEIIFQSSDILLTPIRVGGGTNFKILEAMAVGTPVLTSELGNEGIMAKEGSEILIARKPEEYAAKAINILEDNYLYEKIARNARLFVEQNYDWKKIAERLDAVYKSAAKV